MSSTDTGTALRIRPYDRSDESAVLALLVGSLGQGPSGRRSPEFFRWKHLENPFGPSLLLVAESGGEIVGLRAFMRWRFQAGDRIVRAVRAVDTVTHPEHQGKGIFRRLTTHAIEALRADTDLVFNTPNALSLPGYLKMGWRTVGAVPIRVRVRRPLRFVRGIRTVRSKSARPDRRIDVEAPAAREALGDPQELRDFAAEIRRPDERLVTPVDADYLRWRYAAAPLGYHAIVERGAEGVRGIGLFRVRPRGTLWEATIADVLVRQDDRATAAVLLDRICASAPVDHATCSFPDGSAQERAARRRRFLRSPKGELLTVNTLTTGLEPALDLAGWGVTLGTLEVF